MVTNQFEAREHVIRLAGALVLCLGVALFGCSSGRQERWIIPAGYTGWLRLDYGVWGAPPLPLNHGQYEVRMSRSGRLQTSTINISPIDDNGYYSAEASGLKQLVFKWPYPKGYAIQNVYGNGVLNAKGKPEIHFECVFAGTSSEFLSNCLDCRDWPLGMQQPRRFARCLPRPDADDLISPTNQH